MKTWLTKNGCSVIQVLSGRSNVFLVKSGKKNMLIDTGPRFMRKILNKRLERLGIEKIDLLVLTHAHFDHVANASMIKKCFKAAVFIHQSEAANLKAGINTFTSPVCLTYKILINKIFRPLPDFLKYEPCAIDSTFENILDLKDSGLNAIILHTPGHTIGSSSVIVDDEIALTGDCMFGIFRNSIFPPFAEDTVNMIISWRKLLETNCRLFIPSHGWANKRSLVQKEYDKQAKLISIEEN